MKATTVLRYSDRTVGLSDLSQVTKDYRKVHLERCLLDDWSAVLGGRLAGMRYLLVLTLTGCQLEDHQFMQLRWMTQLEGLCLST